mmetsp:Transcript_66238/g.191194  ORF Transcript_66238/g.191194 Transcript_66238/m.191194 type:complete len:542 (-) Transcript_66238:287-1912(-)
MKTAQQQHVFAFIFPMASGHINPSLPVARALASLGHEVHYLCREQMRQAIEDTGAIFHSDIDVETELYDGRSPDLFGALESLRHEFGLGDESVNFLEFMTKLKNIQLELMLPGVIRWLGDLQATAVMYCPLMNPEASYASKFLGIPSVALLTIAGPGSCPRTFDEFISMCGGSREEVLEMCLSFQPKLEATRRMNDRYGLGLSDAEMFQPFGKLELLAKSAVTLVTTCEDLQDPMPAELAAYYAGMAIKFESVGPLLDEGARRAAGHKFDANSADGTGVDAHPSNESDIVARVRAARAVGRKVVAVSMGTVITGDSPEVGWDARPMGPGGVRRGLTGRELCRAAWAAAFDAFGAEDAEAGPLLIVALGPQPDALGEVRPPANAICRPSIPQVDVLKAGVDLFLTHGGQNSFTESLASGAPVVVCPGFGDQPVNARKAEALGVGLQVPRPEPDEEQAAEAAARYRADVAEALRRVVAEPAFAEASQACATRVASCGGVPRAVRVMLELSAGAAERPLPREIEKAAVMVPAEGKAANARHAGA